MKERYHKRFTKMLSRLLPDRYYEKEKKKQKQIKKGKKKKKKENLNKLKNQNELPTP